MSENTEQQIAAHYTHGALETAILNAAAAAGKDIEHLTVDDLAAVDEFHIGGRQATADFAGEIGLVAGMRVLDVGCGLGGPARYLAKHFGVHITGIDLTQEFVDVAASVSARVGIADHLEFRQGSAAALPFADASFDGAYMMHVGMNIPDKAGVFAEVLRVLKPGGVFGVYDVMREGEGDLSFPVPWASVPETSFVRTPAEYSAALEAAGFTVEKQRSRREFALAFFEQMRARVAAAGGPPALGLPILMGPTAGQKVANMIDNLTRSLIAPVEVIARKR